ncbi:MAG: four helix bundle protein [Sulfurihydrogenibium sp.]|jgi:four helix bundle protein|nr:four helix bundle protein [Sulfurihydrogenibium sp.]
MRTHKDLNVWKNSMDLAEKIYKITNDFPKEELYGLVSQMRRCAISIPSNIAEGFARNSTKELIQFLYIASGSISELETQLLLSQRLGYLKDISVLEDLERIRAGLLNLIKTLKSKTRQVSNE